MSFAMSHSHDSSHEEHSSMHHGEHDGMSAEGGMFIIGEMTSKGVKGMAHLKDVRDAMQKMGLKKTHHFMIAFVDEETGEQIESGKVALKLQDPDAKVYDPIELVGMDGHFGADIVLDMKGEYHFKLGTQLEDGTKRKYHFHYKVK
jgi:hypothetical protein